MDESTCDLNDPEFLLSRSLDETLNETQRALLEEALRDSNDLRRLRDVFGSLNGWMKRLGQEQVTCDSPAFVDELMERVASEDAPKESVGLDSLLDRWGAAQVEVDAKDFTASVMSAVAGDDARLQHVRPRRLVWRLVAPLAAAAAIVLALTANQWGPARMTEVCVIRMGPAGGAANVDSDFEASLVVATAVVEFDRTAIVRERTQGISFGTVWSGSRDVGVYDPPPI